MSLGKLERTFPVKGRKAEAEMVEKLCCESKACPKLISNPAKSGEHWASTGAAKNRGYAKSQSQLFLAWVPWGCLQTGAGRSPTQLPRDAAWKRYA